MHLNNLAISLQERHCNKEAYETFQSALEVMKAASLPAQPSTSKGQHRDGDVVDVDLTLRRAAQLCSSAVDPSSASADVPFTVLSDDSDFADAVNRCSQSSSSSVAVLIRFEEYGTNCSSATRDVDLDCSVILQNIALSSLYLASSSTASDYDPAKSSSTRAAGLAANSARLFELARIILYRRTTACVDDKDMLRKVMLISLITTMSMAQAMSACGEDSKVQDCIIQLERIKTAVLELGLAGYPKATPSAPAA